MHYTRYTTIIYTDKNSSISVDTTDKSDALRTGLTVGYKTDMSVAMDVGSADMGQQKVSYWAEVKSVLWMEGSTDGEAVGFTDRIAEDECYVWLLRNTRSSNHATENIFQKRYRNSGS